MAGPHSVVHLFHVSDSPALAMLVAAPNPPPFAARVETPEAEEKRVGGHLRRLVPAESLARGVRTEVRVVHDPNVTSQIVAEASRLGADVIVMGSHGRTGFGRVLLGSVATDVLRQGTVPVILVHDRRRRLVNRG